MLGIPKVGWEQVPIAQVILLKKVYAFIFYYIVTINIYVNALIHPTHSYSSMANTFKCLFHNLFDQLAQGEEGAIEVDEAFEVVDLFFGPSRGGCIAKKSPFPISP